MSPSTMYTCCILQVSGQEGREFVVTGPHLGTPWLLRAGSRDDALAWCQAFAYASRFGRAMRAHRERPPPPPPDAEVEAKRVEEYRALIDGIVADAPVSPMTDERAGKVPLTLSHLCRVEDLGSAAPVSFWIASGALGTPCWHDTPHS